MAARSCLAVGSILTDQRSPLWCPIPESREHVLAPNRCGSRTGYGFRLMQCRHPSCPKFGGGHDWADVLAEIGALGAEKAHLLRVLEENFDGPPTAVAQPRPLPTTNNALLKRLLETCPCLFNQVAIRASASATVHLCELTLEAPIDSGNVHEAFLIQHPHRVRTTPTPP